ncbi:MAG: 2'-5' RNA ligase family protein [Elainellaceae cyanobacterium]
MNRVAMPIEAGYSKFFVALLLPLQVQEYANQVTKDLGDRYNTRAAKAPPHITLFPPFEWQVENVVALESSIQEFASKAVPVPVTLSGFGAFRPRVIYINVIKSPELLDLHAHLLAHLENRLGIVDPKSKSRAFSPHVTVASRNMARSVFKQAWADVSPVSVQFEFVSDRLTLLSHDGHVWQVRSGFTLNGTSNI